LGAKNKNGRLNVANPLQGIEARQKAGEKGAPQDFPGSAEFLPLKEERVHIVHA
jgi:hypothetical protein